MAYQGHRNLESDDTQRNWCEKGAVKKPATHVLTAKHELTNSGRCLNGPIESRHPCPFWFCDVTSDEEPSEKKANQIQQEKLN